MSADPSPVRPLADLWAVFAGPAIWAAHFAVMYGAEALACTEPWADGSRTAWLGFAATLLALGALGISVGFNMRRHRAAPRGGNHGLSPFLQFIALTLTALSALGIAWTALPIMLLATCAPLV